MTATALEKLTDDELSFLEQNWEQLAPPERSELRAIINYRQRGCRYNRWMNMVRPNPHRKQVMALAYEGRELLFGGAAGGGKSDFLLLAMMQYLDIPGYSAIIFRRTFPDLTGKGSIMERAKTWFTPLQRHGVRWSAFDKAWYFPTRTGKEDARLSFAYLAHPKDKYNYQGWELNACAFDELSQHPRESYSYLFSRIRRLKGSLIPSRMRAASNPGGEHGEWVKEDFIGQDFIDADSDTRFSKTWNKASKCAECDGTGISNRRDCIYCEGAGMRMRIFVPARLEDNPALDADEYRRGLALLPVVQRYQLEHGDWQITEQGDLFKTEWMRFYSRNGDHYKLHRPDGPDIVFATQELIFFITADTASKEKTTADFTCISTWAFHQRTGSLLLIHSLLQRLEVPKIADAIINQSAAAKSLFVMIEGAQCGIGVIQELKGPKGKGMAIHDYNPGGYDKVSRSTTAQVKLSNGQIYFPAGRPTWLDDPTAQMVGFPRATHDDFVDTLSMAASWVHSRHQIGSGGQPAILPPVGR